MATHAVDSVGDGCFHRRCLRLYHRKDYRDVAVGRVRRRRDVYGCVLLAEVPVGILFGWLVHRTSYP